MEKIRIALAGFGMSAQVFHLPFWRVDPRFEVVKVFERSGNKAQEALPQAKIVHSFSELLTGDVDLVVITTPNQTHFDFAQQALAAGKNVVVEKPLCTTAAEAEALAKLAEEQGVLLTVYQNRRWDSAPLTAKKLISDGLLGEIVDAEFRFERYAAGLNKKRWKETGEAGVGLVYDLGSHLIDMAVDIFGMPSEIYADIRRQHKGAISDDNFDIALYYADGKKVSLIGSKYAREPLPFMVLHGKSGSYIKPAADNQEALLVAGVSPVGDWNAESEDEHGLLHTETGGQTVRKKIESVRGNYDTFYENLYQAMNGKAAPVVQPQQVAQVIGLIEKAYESAEMGRRIKV
ncbi:Gfo/Idh/MocA family oxidoreductase [Neisseria chenwenguii]|uniref:Gfo/Idh/MocA family oxidoreductase n=1 Tax=Neisseria chenwenguii TaxID=1853278 RepID=UPI000F4E9F93|nr:Gfo/Idh/MocA family oxidoreductase [Neisseria chenwenguii]ROV55455.1 gfo/Idh/MocA family oxidoreductase [Neisseria chenwenguii]